MNGAYIELVHGDYKPIIRGYHLVPSGKLTVCELENGPVEIVDLPIRNGDFP